MASTRGLQRDEFESLYLRLEKPLYNVLYRLLWNRDESLDVAQEAFVKLWNARSTVELATVEALVFRMALNLAKNRLRLRAVRQFFAPLLKQVAHAQFSADEVLENTQQAVALRRAIDGLPEKLKAVMLLTHWSGLSTAQVSETLQIPTGTVASRRSLALEALRRHLHATDLEVPSE